MCVFRWRVGVWANARCGAPSLRRCVGWGQVKKAVEDAEKAEALEGVDPSLILTTSRRGGSRAGAAAPPPPPAKDSGKRERESKGAPSPKKKRK